MSEKNKPINRNVPAVLSIITDNSSGLVSVILTRRHPSDIEQRLADWIERLRIGNVDCRVIGRGPGISLSRLCDLADALINSHAPFEQYVAPVNDAGIEFENDPFWQHIKAIARGE